MIERRIDKNRFSEYVVRQALYWMSHRASWQLSESEQEWIVQFSAESDIEIYEFERLLNDYLLRERLSHQTIMLRERITLSVLESVERKLRL